MKDSFYYYGIGPEAFKNLKYTDALRMKVQAGKELLNELSSELYLKPIKQNMEEWGEMAERLNDVVKAIQFNERLLRECGERV